MSNGALKVTSDAADPITIICDTGKVKVNGDGPGGAPNCADIKSISVTGGPGANLIDLDAVNGTDFPALTSVTTNGGDGEDTLLGSQLADRLIGGKKNDTVTGNAGNDTLVWNPATTATSTTATTGPTRSRSTAAASARRSP